MLVKPAPGLKVRDPVTRQFVPDDGIEVSETDLYWVRALRDGDVVDATPPAAEPAPATKPAIPAPPPAPPTPPAAPAASATSSTGTAG